MSKTAPTLELIGIREFARRDGCDEKRVRKAIQSGHLIAVDGTKLDASQVGTGWRLTNRRTADTPAPKVRTPPQVSAMSAPAPPGVSAGMSPAAEAFASIAAATPRAAAKLLAPVLPRMVLEPLLADLTRVVRQLVTNEADRVAPPPHGLDTWDQHPAFRGPALTDEEWRALAPATASALSPDASRAESERVKEYYLALLRKLEYERANDQVLSLDAMEEVVGRLLFAVRAGCLRLPSAAAPILAPITSPAEVYAELTRLVYDVLTNLSDAITVMGEIKNRSADA